MVEPIPKDPLKIISQLNQKSLNYLRQINILCENHIDTININNSSQDIKSTQIISWFNTICPKINSSLRTVFFPALIESMAGSDAICIKDMTNHFLEQSKSLDRQWQHGIVKKIQQAIIDQPTYNAIASWSSAYEQILILCNEEIIPMANRLLDDNAIQKIGSHFITYTHTSG